ncbi:MAG TPA: GNAT family N-acetyltransferase [Ktedonobacterales bacterium]
MPFTARMYARRADRDRITRFLSEANVGEPRPGIWELGSFTWAFYQHTTFDPTRSIRLWEDAATGALLGFVWLASWPGAGEITVQIRPDVRETAEGVAILADMLAWARRVGTRRQLTQLQALALDSDAWQIERLAAAGFAHDPTNAGYVHFRRPFDAAPLPETPLPPGFTVRAVGGPDEWQRRVDAHRAAFHPSRVTLESYRRVRAAPTYRPDLDLVAVAPDGQFVAYCILWYDERARVGEYEPVGAHPDWRRQGLSRAVLVEGLRRAQALGAERAMVLTAIHNTPAVRLYESVGFVQHDYERNYADARKIEELAHTRRTPPQP